MLLSLLLLFVFSSWGDLRGWLCAQNQISMYFFFFFLYDSGMTFVLDWAFNLKVKYLILSPPPSCSCSSSVIIIIVPVISVYFKSYNIKKKIHLCFLTQLRKKTPHKLNIYTGKLFSASGLKQSVHACVLSHHDAYDSDREDALCTQTVSAHNRTDNIWFLTPSLPRRLFRVGDPPSTKTCWRIKKDCGWDSLGRIGLVSCLVFAYLLIYSLLSTSGFMLME